MASNENKPENEQIDECGETVEVVEYIPDSDVELNENNPQSELAEFKDKYLRVLAEFDNFRKRTTREKASMYDDGIIDTVSKFLPVIDNLARALGSATNTEDPLYKGVDMIEKQILKTLAELGVEEIAAKGQPFDPNRHFAVAHEQDSNYSENTVTDELQKGYKYKDKVLRHSMVKVAN
ncbi:MAG: nucleotide exchange factor GrpE [Defluviitaleaceae bacterium]|nr:nucleotide exchange factor GrpE [Defluviitaleaceae bacterium]